MGSVRRRLLRPSLLSALRRLPLPWAAQRRLRFLGEIEVRIDREHAFRMHASGHIENDLFWRGFGNGWEGTSLRAWAGLAALATCVIDIGSNVGVYALAARAVNPAARIVAFEPLPRMHERLAGNVALNGYVMDLEMAGVSDTTGTATLFDSPKDNFKEASLERPAQAGDAVAVSVPVVRLDDYCQERRIERVDLMKLDVEGHEAAALRGMAELLGAYRPTLLIEVVREQSALALAEVGSRLGYELYRIDEGRGLVPMTTPVARRGKHRNYLACSPGTLERAGLSALVVAP